MGKLENRFPRYATLLKLYPAAYKKRYGREILQTLADMLDDPENSKTAVWTRTILDLPISVAKQQIIYTGGIMSNETPYYVKRNAIIGAGLITPFFVIVFSRVLQNNTHISTSVVWQSSLLITLVMLPFIAFLLNLATFLKWSHQRKKTFWKSLLDFRHNWMMLAIGGLGLLIFLFVPFHDSAHCVTGNPVRELRNFSQTVRCIQNG
jgi:hypothetical protein